MNNWKKTVSAFLTSCWAVTCSKSRMETTEHYVKYVQSKQYRHQSGAIEIVLMSLLLTLNGVNLNKFEWVLDRKTPIVTSLNVVFFLWLNNWNSFCLSLYQSFWTMVNKKFTFSGVFVWTKNHFSPEF